MLPAAVKAMSENGYAVIVVGGGHAGAEAAWAAARTGADTVLITMSRDTIAQMSCNPAIGGLAKGQIVREIDALGGIMALAADATGIQFRMLNSSKGPAVWAPRAQSDKLGYQAKVRNMLENCGNLTIIEDIVDGLLVADGRVTGVQCGCGREIFGQAVVLTTGTFMRGLMHTGEKQDKGGRFGEPSAEKLSDSLQECGLNLGRLKTGTPARIAAESMDYDKLQPQPGDDEPLPFSFLNAGIEQKQIPCWITYTNEKTHAIIKNNLDRAPLYTGQIKTIGPRYCPSIETKIVRFADKSRHQVFLEPEGLDTNWIYCNGVSTSLPCDVQEDMLHSISGLENAKILRYGYAIEYDYVPPLQIRATLESKKVSGLFLAGQINGTSGYEEAGGQGLIAGVNAARYCRRKEGVIIRRDQGYIGVMIDDLVTKGVDEPYRMFTSRAEHRLLLRSDNADERLTPLGHDWGLVDDDRWQRFQAKQQRKETARTILQGQRIGGKSMEQLLCQQGRDVSWLLANSVEMADKLYDKGTLQTVVSDIRYAGYIEKQRRLIEKFQQIEKMKLPRDFDYSGISQLRNEAKGRLNAVKPLNLGQASRITGITPADITVLMIHFGKDRQKK